MALPKAGLSFEWSPLTLSGEPGKVTSPKYVIPHTIAGSKMAGRVAGDSARQDLSLSPLSLSLEVSKPGFLDDIGLCGSEVCKKQLNFGVTGGYQLGGMGAWKAALFAEYDHPIAEETSVVVRAQTGIRIFSGREFSYAAMDYADLSGVKWESALMVGLRTLFYGIPVSLRAGVVAGPGADLAPGFRAEGGVAAVVTLSVDDVVKPVMESMRDKVGPVDVAPSAEPTDEAKCKAAADALTLNVGALAAAVAKCAGSALPVFEAMAAKLKAFTLNASNLDTYRSHLLQFAEGIRSAGGSRLTPSETTAKAKALASLYVPLLDEMKKSPSKTYFDTAIEALKYTYIDLLKETPPDADIKEKADGILRSLLALAIKDGGFLPNVLDELVKIGAGSGWLKSHKQDLLDAAKKITSKAERTQIVNLINTKLK